MASTPSPARAGAPKSYRRPFAYPLFFTAAGLGVLAASAGTGQSNLVGYPGQISVFTHIGFASDGPFLLQITPSDLGGGLFQAPVSSETILAMLDRPGQWPVPVVLRGNETARIDLVNDFGAVANAVRITFFGYREIPAPGQSLC